MQWRERGSRAGGRAERGGAKPSDKLQLVGLGERAVGRGSFRHRRRRRGRGGWGDADLHTLPNRTDRGNGRDELLSGWLRKKEPSGLLGSLGCVVVRESTHGLNPPDGVGIFTFAITRSTNPNSRVKHGTCATSPSSLGSGP